MELFWNIWQNLPLYIEPEIFSAGFFSLRWYSLGYLAAFATILLLILYRIRQNELPRFSRDKLSKDQQKDLLFNIFLVSALGMLLGARIGYFLFYDWQGLIENPAEVFLPIRSGELQGFFGMSFHGGVLGALLSAFAYAKWKQVNFSKLLDFFIPAVPLAYFWGRMGNFFNKELFGKITEKSWGMRFESSGSALRHPTQLYEAFLEGIVIFLILWPLRNKKFFQGKFLGIYLILYGIFRFLIEFFRQTPPEHFVLNFFTLGQVLSLALIAGGGYLLQNNKRF
ncbi:MAG: prolipoprotein diacylglyceryl transferase [Candidatus Moranbacteria bacterium]|nr:prolipoprotein diacylglyceryl transferase [Candidatus Moranbacteria bacterium]